MKERNVVLVGATGLVGSTMLRVLEERNFPLSGLRIVASRNSRGMRVKFGDAHYTVESLSKDVFEAADIALFSAGSEVSRKWAPIAVEMGVTVVDNSSAWRMENTVPLIVPEVNASALVDAEPRIIANPNCSTIQLVVVLKPLADIWGLRRVFVATYQAVSGAGWRGIEQLEAELRGEQVLRPAFPHPITENALPHIAAFLDDGYTVEERKMVNETRKILDLPDLPVSPTCVRIPVAHVHSEAVHVELGRAFDLEELRTALATFPGIVLQDDTDASLYPMARTAKGHDEVFVGRLRKDASMEHGLAMWIVSDNVRKGAATNAVQIAELWNTRKSLTA